MTQETLIKELITAYDEYLRLLEPYETILDMAENMMRGAGGSGGGSMVTAAYPTAIAPGMMYHSSSTVAPNISVPMPDPKNIQRVRVLQELIREIKQAIEDGALSQSEKPAGEEVGEVQAEVRDDASRMAALEALVAKRGATIKASSFYSL